MAQIKINIPDNMVTKLINAFATAYQYEAMIPNPADPNGAMIPNPESKAAFARRQIQEYVKQVYISAKAGADIDDLRKVAIDAAATEIAPVEVE